MCLVRVSTRGSPVPFTNLAVLIEPTNCILSDATMQQDARELHFKPVRCQRLLLLTLRIERRSKRGERDLENTLSKSQATCRWLMNHGLSRRIRARSKHKMREIHGLICFCLLIASQPLSPGGLPLPLSRSSGPDLPRIPREPCLRRSLPVGNHRALGAARVSPLQVLIPQRDSPKHRHSKATLGQLARRMDGHLGQVGIALCHLCHGFPSQG